MPALGLFRGGGVDQLGQTRGMAGGGSMMDGAFLRGFVDRGDRLGQLGSSRVRVASRHSSFHGFNVRAHD